MNIAFWDNQLCERGTTTSLFDYAYYNELLLKNKSFIFYEKNNKNNKDDIIDKFESYFIVHGVDEFKKIDYYIKKYKITHLYIIKHGDDDGKLSKIAKNCVHCVFACNQPHGDVYSCISSWIKGNNGKYPVVPHMINIPKHNRNMRKELNIPKDAVVFGSYGGKPSFSIPFVHKVVYKIAKENPSIYFLFANFDPFCDRLPNIIHLPAITDLDEKVKFINTTDAMLWARKIGETFGIAIGEFSTMNKPVFAMKIGDLAHVDLLGDKGIWYNEKNLSSMLLKFDPEVEKTKDWNAYRNYTPKKVMKIFKKVYLD